MDSDQCPYCGEAIPDLDAWFPAQHPAELTDAATNKCPYCEKSIHATRYIEVVYVLTGPTTGA